MVRVNDSTQVQNGTLAIKWVISCVKGKLCTEALSVKLQWLGSFPVKKMPFLFLVDRLQTTHYVENRSITLQPLHSAYWWRCLLNVWSCLSHALCDYGDAVQPLSKYSSRTTCHVLLDMFKPLHMPALLWGYLLYLCCHSIALYLSCLFFSLLSNLCICLSGRWKTRRWTIQLE